MINNKLLKTIMEAHGDKDIIKKLIDNLHVSRLSATQIINGERKLFPSERVALSHMLFSTTHRLKPMGLKVGILRKQSHVE